LCANTIDISVLCRFFLLVVFVYINLKFSVVGFLKKLN
jgi:hypothetical protein